MRKAVRSTRARTAPFATFAPTVADTAVRVTDDEIRKYFEAHRDDFGDRQGRAVLSLISLPRPITAADSAATRQHAVDLRMSIVGDDQENMLPDRLTRRIAEQPLSRPVPRCDDAVEGLTDDRVV